MARTQQRQQPRVLVAHPGAELYGSDRMLIESVSGLLDAGWQVVVALAEAGPLEVELRQLGAIVTYCPTTVLRKTALHPTGLVRLLAQTGRSIHPSMRLLRMSDPDAVYVNTLTVPLWITLSRLNRRYTVCHVHEAERPRRAVIGRGLAAPLRMCHQVLVNSEYSGAVLQRSGRRLRGRTRLVRNGVIGPTAARAPRPRLDGPLRVLFAGRLSHRKGPQVALGAIRRLHRAGVPVTVRVVGEAFRGQERFVAQLRADYQDLIDDGVLEFRGFRPDIWPELEWCDVAVVPSILPEPFGNAAVEAVLAARPVVVSDIGGLPEAVADVASAVVVPPGDAAALAIALGDIREQWPIFAGAAVAASVPAGQRFDPRRYRDEISAALTHRASPYPQQEAS